jgi:protoheme IX farnesyltransferase
LFKEYYRLTKPGIIYGNAITAVAGFLLASKSLISLPLLAETVGGVALVIGSACVINNYIDRGIDRKMARTKNRALVTGLISGRNALLYAAILGLIGFGLLIYFTNLLTVSLGIIGYLDYLVLYGFSKRTSIHGTVIGSISGAVPVTAGYCAVTNRFDTGALLLFLTLVMWQMPHFYAIAIARLKDYSSAKLPVLPVKSSMVFTKVQIVLYVGGFIVVSSLLTVFGYTGYIYVSLMGLAGLTWLRYGIQGFYTKQDTQWARKMFRLSLIIIMTFSVLVSFGTRIA